MVETHHFHKDISREKKLPSNLPNVLADVRIAYCRISPFPCLCKDDIQPKRVQKCLILDNTHVF